VDTPAVLAGTVVPPGQTFCHRLEVNERTWSSVRAHAGSRLLLRLPLPPPHPPPPCGPVPTECTVHCWDAAAGEQPVLASAFNHTAVHHPAPCRPLSCTSRGMVPPPTHASSSPMILMYTTPAHTALLPGEHHRGASQTLPDSPKCTPSTIKAHVVGNIWEQLRIVHTSPTHTAYLELPSIVQRHVTRSGGQQTGGSAARAGL